MIRCLFDGFGLHTHAVQAILFLLLAPTLACATDVSGVVKGRWTDAMSPVRVVGDCLVPAGETLHIDPGVSVLLIPGTTLRVEGSLYALAAPTRSIRFERASIERPWRALEILTGGSAHLQSCAVVGGGSAGVYENSGMLRLLGGSLNLTACRVSGSVSSGIYIQGGTLTSRRSSFLQNGGALPTDAAIHVVEGDVILGQGTDRNTLVNHTFYAIYNENLTPVTAPDTWWGSPSGPQHPDNVLGMGSSVSDDVMFAGFATVPPARRWGDVNADGIVDREDVALATGISGGTATVDVDSLSAADVFPADSPDGRVDLMDVLTISHAIRG